MKAKVCFQDEIHRISKLPTKLNELKTHVAHIFQSSLPEFWALQYIDSDMDKIMIQDEKDYEEFQKFVLSGNGASITKIYVEPLMMKSSALKREEDEYQIIREEEEVPQQNLEETIKIDNKEEIQEEKIEEKVEEKIEEPVKPVVQEEVQKTEEPAETNRGEETEGEKVQEVEKTEVEVEETASFLSEKSDEKKESVELAGDGRILIDLKTLERLMLGIIEDKIPMIIQKTKEALKQDQEERKVEVIPKEEIEVPKEEEKKWYHHSQKKHRKSKKWKRIEVEEEKPNNQINDLQGMTRTEQERFKMVYDKAEKMLKCFPKQDLDLLLAFVNEAPDDMTLEELVENYKIN